MLAFAGQCRCEGIVKRRPILVEFRGKRHWAVWGDEAYPFDEPQ